MKINYQPARTAIQFHEDDSFVRFILGPIGSGKSVSCAIELLRLGMEQNPGPDGIRRTRHAIIRESYPQLKSTTIKTFQDWIPNEICPIKWDTPIHGTLRTAIGDGTVMDAEFVFLALDKPSDVEKLKSLELSSAWINEASGIDKGHFDMLTGRVGRYPNKVRQGGCTRPCIIVDSNMVDDLHWLYKLYEDRHNLDGYSFFRQPPALIKDPDSGLYVPNPEAENTENLPGGHDYYLRQVPGKSEDWINVFILANWGSLRDGKPVWPEFSEAVHVSPKVLEPIRGIPVIIGMDFGLEPTAIFLQIQNSSLCVIDEVGSTGCGTRQFIRDYLKPHLFNKYRGYDYSFVCDPAGVQRGQSAEGTSFKEMCDAGFNVNIAPTNEFTARRDAVASFLTRMSLGQPGFFVSPHCKMVKKALAGGYFYKRVQVAGVERYKLEPEKNEFSHYGDALQYGCLTYDKLNKRRGRPQVSRKQYRPAAKTAGY